MTVSPEINHYVLSFGQEIVARTVEKNGDLYLSHVRALHYTRTPDGKFSAELVPLSPINQSGMFKLGSSGYVLRALESELPQALIDNYNLDVTGLHIASSEDFKG
jgi:hypothetical protein